MNVALSGLMLGLLTSVRFVSLPTLVLLVAYSLWKRRAGVVVPLWKLGGVLAGATLVGTLAFAFAWQGAVR